MRDVHAQMLRWIAVGSRPNSLKQLAVREGAAGECREGAQHAPLDRCQANLLPSSRHPAPSKVDANVARDDDAWDTGAMRLGAAKLDLHSRFELAEAERFRDVVVGTGAQQTHLLILRMACGQHDDRSLRPRAHAAAHIVPRHVGKAEVENDQLRLLCRGDVQSRAPGRCLEDATALRAERVRNGASDLKLIVDDENGVGGYQRVAREDFTFTFSGPMQRV
jgi:hypothetical protein